MDYLSVGRYIHLGALLQLKLTTQTEIHTNLEHITDANNPLMITNNNFEENSLKIYPSKCIASYPNTNYLPTGLKIKICMNAAQQLHTVRDYWVICF